MKQLFIFLTFATSIIGLLSCSSNEANYKALVAHSWELHEIISSDSTSTQLPPVKVEITFSDSSTVSGFAGCNNFFGTYATFEQDQITINPAGRTMAFCPFMSFEDKLMEILPLCTSYTASQNILEINDTENGTTLLFKAKL